MQPPIARKAHHVHEEHGYEREDPYFWLREKDSEEVLAYLNAENAYTDHETVHTKAFQEALFEEIKGHIKQDDESVPQIAEDGWWYFTRRTEDKQYPVIIRKVERDADDEQVVLDLNVLGDEHEFVSLGDWDIPKGTNKLWYTVDLTGYRQYKLRCQDLDTGEVTEFSDGDDSIFNRITSFEFVEGRDDAMWFTVEDEETKRSHQVYFWFMSGSPKLVFQEEDERFNVGIRMTADREFITVLSASHTTSEVYFADARLTEARLLLLYKRQQDIEIYSDHRNGRWYSMVNDKGRNFRIVVGGGGEELVPHDPEVMIEGFSLFKDHMVVATRKEGISSILVTKFMPKAVMDGEPEGSGILPLERIEFPEEVISCGIGTNNLMDTDTVRVGYGSMTTPGVTYDCDLDTLELTELKRQEVLGKYDPDDYVAKRIYATSPDGTTVPISITHRKDTPLDGSAPMYLTGYGSYGAPMPISFSYVRLSLLDRGFVYALAHIRGGGERGKAWHDDGRMLNKMNTFTDFIACAEQLVAEKFTSPKRLCIEGASAGGLLIGAVVNMRPDLFGCVITDVPFVDVLTTMLDSTMPLTVGEYEEWGDPNNDEDYEYIRQYCPITNVEAKVYPPMLVRTSYNDSQVMYWEPAKYVAKLRDLKTDDNTLLFKCLMEAGHGGKSGRYDAYRDAAFDLAFIFDQFGISS